MNNLQLSSQIINVYTGKEFNRFNVGTKFYKVTNRTENHRGLQYDTGLIIDSQPLNTKKYYGSGIHFCSESDLHKWILPTGDFMVIDGVRKWVEDIDHKYFIREVKIPSDATVCTIHGIPKTNKLILGERISIWNNYELCLKFLKRNIWEVLKYIKVDLQTEEMVIYSLHLYWEAIKYIRSDLQTDEMAKYVVGVTWASVPFIRPDLRTETMQQICVLMENMRLVKFKKIDR